MAVISFMAMVTYTKPYRSVAQLIELLKARGLVFDGEEDMARRYVVLSVRVGVSPIEAYRRIGF